jgi:D-Tyr-tRNAtyr deacylase
MPPPAFDAAYFLKEADRLQEDYERKVEKLAARIRKALVVPLCKKYNLQFLSGNGSFSFYTKRGLRDEWEVINDAETAEQVLDCEPDEFAECFKALNADVNSGKHNVGMWCMDVDNGPGTEE